MKLELPAGVDVQIKTELRFPYPAVNRGRGARAPR
jgi:hypothetical protein